MHTGPRVGWREGLRSYTRGSNFDPRSALWPAGTEAGLWLDPSDAATVYQDSAGTTPGALNSPVGGRVDKRLGSTTIAGPGNHVLQATAASRPTWKLNGAIYSDLMDGVDDGYSTATFVAGTLTANMDCFLAIKRNSANSAIPIFGDGTVKGIGIWNSADASSRPDAGSGTPTYLVDGNSVVANRQALDTALTTGVYHVLEIRNADLSTWTLCGLSNWSGGGFITNGDEGGLILCPAQSTANRNSIRTYLGSKVGLSL